MCRDLDYPLYTIFAYFQIDNFRIKLLYYLIIFFIFKAKF